jgi:hypothetical protein
VTWENDIPAWKTAAHRRATPKRRRLPWGWLIFGAFLGFILLVIIIPKSNRQGDTGRAKPYLQIAAQFNEIADNPSAYDLDTMHKRIGALWDSCSTTPMESLLQRVKEPPRDRWEQADRYVAMGQMTIALMRANGTTPKLRNDLRDSARKLANTVD